MLKTSQNKNHFSCRLKAAWDDVRRIDSGRRFHGPQCYLPPNTREHTPQSLLCTNNVSNSVDVSATYHATTVKLLALNFAYVLESFVDQSEINEGKEKQDTCSNGKRRYRPQTTSATPYRPQSACHVFVNQAS